MMAGKPWEPWEDELLLASPRTTESDLELGRHLGRTVTALRQHRNRICRLGRPHERWSLADDAVCREYHLLMMECVARLGRSRSSIAQRARVLAKRDAARRGANRRSSPI